MAFFFFLYPIDLHYEEHLRITAMSISDGILEFNYPAW